MRTFVVRALPIGKPRKMVNPAIAPSRTVSGVLIQLLPSGGRDRLTERDG
jgi:hypothetical protein